MVAAVSLSDEIRSYVDTQVSRALASMQTAVGTVVTSPSQVSTNPLTVYLDGSNTAVVVKGLRNFPLFVGARVALVKFGTDWTVVGAYTNPGAGTGSSRIVIGGDVPAELRAYGIDAAILVYITEKTTGLEAGYFFMGSSNRFDGSGDSRVFAMGNVSYPTLGDPSTAVMSNVKTNMQFDMWAQYRDTLFKDHRVVLWTNMDWETQNGFSRTRMMDGSGNLVAQFDINDIQSGQPGTTSVETWHTATLQNGWTGTMKYMRVPSPQKAVWIVGAGLSPGTKADGTTVFNLPTGYRPANAQDIDAVAAPSVNTQSPHFNVTTGGNVNCWGFGSATSGGVSALVSLNW